MGGFVLQTVLITGLLSIVVVVAGRTFRLSPAVRFGLWLVVLIKLLIPPVVEWPWDATALFPEGVSLAWVTNAPIPGSPLPTGRTVVGGETERVVPTTVGSNAGIESGMSFTIGWFFLTAWLMGSLILLVGYGRRILRFHRALSASDPAPDRIVKIAAQTAQQLGIHQPSIRVLGSLGSPIVWSFGRPLIVIPAPLLVNRDAGFWRCILAHELAHLRRRDHWFVWLEFAASIVWWWNPLYWLVRYKLRTNAEMAADRWAVSLDPEGRRTYAESLLWVTEWGSGLSRAIPALGASSRSREQFAGRLSMILQGNHNVGIPRLGTLLLILIHVLTIPNWTFGGDAPEGVEDANEVRVVAVRETNPGSDQWRSGWSGFTGDRSPTSPAEAFITLTPYDLSTSGQVVLPKETYWMVRANNIGARAQDGDDNLIVVLMDPTYGEYPVTGFWPVIVEMPLSNARKLQADLADAIRMTPPTGDQVSGMESSIYTRGYPLAGKKLYGEAEWKVVPRTASVDQDGEGAHLAPAITVGLQDSTRNFWPVVVKMDPGVARTFMADLGHVIEQESGGG